MPQSSIMCRSLFVIFLSTSWHVACLVPGVGPMDYKDGQEIEIKMASMESVLTQTPQDYYKLPVCRPDRVEKDAQTLGDMLLSFTLQNSLYRPKMKQPEQCTVVCEALTLTAEEAAIYKQRIADNYRVHMEADNMYALTRHRDTISGTDLYALGFPLGSHEDSVDGQEYFVNNHINFTFRYHVPEGSNEGVRVVGVEVEAQSVAHRVEPDGTIICAEPGTTIPPIPLLPQKIDSGQTIYYTYSANFVQSPVTWATRYDIYLHNRVDSPLIHWFSIVNSLVIVLLLSGIVAMILIRVLYRDIAKYNEILMGSEDDLEEKGWKLVHGDVFRKPPHSTVLAALTGSGFQTLGMLAITLGLVGFNTFSRSYRGNLVEVMLFLWACMGGVAGFISSRLYKLFKSPNWKMTTVRTAFVFPGVVFGVFSILNVILRSEGSSAAVSFVGLMSLLLVWMLVSTPLIFLGAYAGYRKSAISLPVRVNKIPRQIPTQPLLMHPVISCLIGGALPFGALFTELLFLFTSIWQHRFYYLFGFLIIVLTILIITCAEISILLVYFQLVCEDYMWWWRSFCISGTCGVYIMLYSVFFFFSRLRLTHLSSILIYFGYSFLIAFAFFILTGAVGFVSTFIFLRKIYGSIKID